MKIGARIAQMAGLSGTITLEQALYTGSCGFPASNPVPHNGTSFGTIFFLDLFFLAISCFTISFICFLELPPILVYLDHHNKIPKTE